MFVHLHSHSEYSALDGFGKLSDAVKRTIEIEQKYFTITDHGVTNGWPALYKEAKGKDIKPIFGVEGYVCNDHLQRGADEKTKLELTSGLARKEANKAVRDFETACELNKRAHIILLAKNEDGIKEIYKGLSIANEKGFLYRPRFDFNLLFQMQNVIVSSACTGGIIAYYFNRGDDQRAYQEAEMYKNHFGDDFYIELMAIDWEEQPKVNYKLAKLAIDLKIKFIITNDNHYILKGDWQIHDVLLAIQTSHKSKPVRLDDPNRFRYAMHDLYIKTEDEMRESFLRRNPKLKQLVERGLNSTIEVAEKCGNKIVVGFNVMPDTKIENEETYLDQLVIEGWKQKIIGKIQKEKLPEYKERVKYELEQIKRSKFVKYFIVVYKLFKWVEEQGIERGPARGSSAGSLVCYLLDITQIDPIPYGLIFARFIDPNRTDNPDIDMDFEDTRRHEIFEYLQREYGEYNVSMLGNNIKFKGKLALKDVSRLFDVPLKDVNEVTELILKRSGADSRVSFVLEDSFNEFEKCKEFKAKYPKVVEYASKLEGQVKSYSSHAAGVVLGNGDIRNYVSLRYEKTKVGAIVPVANIDKRDCEDLGLLKLDILGLRTLTVIKKCKSLIKERHGIDVNLITITPDDPSIYDAYRNGDYIGIFQFETQGLSRLAQVISIDNFDELMAATALHRPGPLMGNQAAQYPQKKKMGIIPKQEHPIIDEIVKNTWGEFIYQEQIMNVVRNLGDFDWKDTNDIRKCMSKSGGAEYFKRMYWDKFKANCAKKGIDEQKADKIFRKAMGFGCLSGYTKIRLPWSNQHSPKQITIKKLYENNGFAKIALDEKNEKHQRIRNRKAKIFSMIKDRIIPVSLIDIYKSGIKITYLVKLENGNKIRATKEHKFLTSNGWKELQFLKIGDFVAVFGDQFPSKKLKGTGSGGHNIRDGRTKLFYEKQKQFKKYIKICLVCEKAPYQETHHIDGNRQNNEWNNLIPVCRKCHKKAHLKLDGYLSIPYLKGHRIAYSEVISISNPKKEMTYDIAMPSPNNNYLAANIVVHNSWAFNLAHACAYGLLSYWTMYLKIKYPIEFMLSQLIYTEKAEKIPKLIKESKRLGVETIEPDINHSGLTFRIVKDKIVCGFDNIKGVGEKAIAEIVSKQPYDDIVDFISKIEKRKVNSRVVRVLAQAGCFKNIHPNAKALMGCIEAIQKEMQKKKYSVNIARSILAGAMRSKDRYNELEELTEKSKVLTSITGRHITTFFEPLKKLFAPHIRERLIKTNDMELTSYGYYVKDGTPSRSVYCVGQIKTMDLKRFSQEVNYVVGGEDDFRYCLCDFEDDQDYCLLSFKSYAYRDYEKKLWEWGKGVVILADGTCITGMRKIYAERCWNLTEIWNKIKASQPLTWDERYLFEHPIKFQFKNIDEIRKKFNCVTLLGLSKGEAYVPQDVIGYIVYVHERRARDATKYYEFVFEDDTYRGKFMIHPNRFPAFKEINEILLKHYYNRHPLILKVMVNKKRIINLKKHLYLGMILLLDSPRTGKFNVIKSPFIIDGKGYKNFK